MTEASPELSTRYMAGNCSHGGAKTGVRWHAVPGPIHGGACTRALCGRRPSIQWSDERPGQAVTCPGCLKALKRPQPKPMYAGDEGLEPVEPEVDLVAFTTVPETGALARIRVLRRAPEHDFDGKPAWAWRWLSGPDRDGHSVAYGRTFWRRAKPRRPARKA